MILLYPVDRLVIIPDSLWPVTTSTAFPFNSYNLIILPVSILICLLLQIEAIPKVYLMAGNAV